MNWRFVGLLIALFISVHPVLAQNDEMMTNDDEAYSPEMQGEDEAPAALTRVDSSVVLFDYQFINDPLSRLEASVSRTRPMVDSIAFLEPNVRSVRAGTANIDGEMPIWRGAWIIADPRGLPEFHPAQAMINEATRHLQAADNTIRDSRATEQAIAQSNSIGRPIDPALTEALVNSRASIRSDVMQADQLLQDARHSLEDNRLALVVAQ